jgi:hypothetical protein
MHLNPWQWFWFAWALVGGIVEVIALCTNTANTLSEQVWAVEGNGPTIIRYIVGACTFWLFIHFTFDTVRVLR